MSVVTLRIGTQSNGIKRIFASEGNWEEIFGAPFYYVKQLFF